MRPRLFNYPCGIHMGPKPVPVTCHVCERLLAEEKARPPVDARGRELTDKGKQARKNQVASGRKNGQANTAKGNDNKRAFPEKRKIITAEDLRRVLGPKAAEKT